ncbi:hypothetical protein [Sphingobium chungbukense]|uniref:hypothetical protein n=1 Tax=Sphingobium chungbukense TaxID=56193 RepID=UPI000A984E58|nr:hypothetical protein [Sphingobium chungbukense]
MLLLPKLAQLAGPRGVIIAAQWYLAGDNVAATLVDGHRIAHFGPVDPLFQSDEIGLSRFAEETTPLPATLRAAYIDQVDIPARVLRRVMHYIETGQ